MNPDHQLSARVRELEQENARLRLRLELDPLTGLGNSAMLSRLSASSGYFILCDLDGLKAVNDTHGHAAGDGLLREFARFLRSGIRTFPSRRTDMIAARLHGDEFALWVGNYAGMRRAINRIRGWHSADYPEVTASAGAGATIEMADARMYAYKRRRKAAKLAATENPRTACQDSDQE